MSDSLITPGSICKLGKGKNATVWEIQTVDRLRNTVYLSKLGGDGFVNKSANIEDLLDVQAQRLPIALWTVLSLRDEVRGRAAAVREKGRFITSAAEIYAQALRLSVAAEKLESANKAYWLGINEFYPELVEK